MPPATKQNSSPVATAQPLKTDDLARRYTVVQQPFEHVNTRRMPPTAPPKVISHKETTKLKSDFAYYDAILAAEKEASSKEDSEMDKFVPLLEEYLRSKHTITAIQLLFYPHVLVGNIGLSSSSGTSAEAAEDDYVWDIFYHYPVKLNEWSKAAVNIGTL
jgi:hypothetical protein